MKEEEFNKIIERLTDEQKECIKAKCRQEQMSWLGVYRNWPDLFQDLTTHQ